MECDNNGWNSSVSRYDFFLKLYFTELKFLEDCNLGLIINVELASGMIAMVGIILVLICVSWYGYVLKFSCTGLKLFDHDYNATFLSMGAQEGKFTYQLT